ncbi:uncharacterized protein isoform X5 [Takifugu rubripes]|uniref:uncharacterized protein isoform X4 n=1 Tax=Takifugu rubripes TaxID=31033 RepID=UPI001145F635|nr:uncharacterized protein LOC101076575 isoform X4 [Takifugu rubripes]XP_029696034.1 uncharacterized protein LOC101076575 isoform X5 [Takifugu rubripes]
MSHHQYNHYASGRPTSAQRQYDHSSMQSEREHRWGSNLGPGSSYGSSGASSSRVERSDRGIPSLLSQTVSYRPEQSRTSMDDIDERAVEIQISRAREEVKGYGKHQPTDQGTRFTTTQREEFHSTGREMHYPMSSSSASGQHRRSDVDSDGSAWTSSYERPASDNSEFYSSSAFKYASSGDSRHNTRREREGEMHSGAGSKDYDYAGREMPSVSTSESSIPKYSPQSAADILLFFGLEKEDLNELKSYPEDQLTPANLPFILRQIRIKKEKTAAGGQKNPYPDPRATTSGSGLESHGMSSSTAASHKGMSSSGVLQSKVIDYGHVSRYTGGITDEVGRTGDSGHDESGSMLLRDPYSHGRDQQEPLQKNRTEMKSAALGASHDQESSVTSQSSLYRSVLNSVDPQTRQLQPSQEVFSPYSLKDTGGGILKSKASKLAPSKELEADRPPTKTIQPAFKPTSKGHGMSPTVTGVVLFDSKNRDAKTQNKSQVKVPTGAEQFKKQQAQEQPQIQRQVQEQPQIHRQVQEQPQIHRQVQEQPQIHRQAQEQPQTQHQPVDQQLKLLQQQQPKVQQPNQPGFQPGQATWLPAFSSSRLVSHNPGLGASPAMGNPAFIPRGPPVVIPPSALPQMMNFGHPNVKMATSSGPSAEKLEASSSQPTLAMMYDYAATSPKSFPHTCSLCKTECIRMKDWIAHQNTVLHLTNCKLLRTRYPNWDGEITLGERIAKDDSKPSTSQDRHQREKHESSSRSRSRSGSRSRSNSSSHQHRYRGYESRRKGRSRSPYSSRYSRRSQSSSPERRSPRRRDDRHHLMRRRQSSPRRSHEWRYSLRRSEESSPLRRSRERRWLSRRSEEFSPPRRSRERRWLSRRSEESPPPGRSRERRRSSRSEEQSPPRRSHERRRSPRRSEEQSPSRRRDRRSSTKESSPQRISTTAEKLARKLLDNSEVKSLTQQSDLEAVVKTLAPALLAELVKMKPSTSTSRAKKDSTSETSQQKSKSNKSSPARTVRLGRIYSVLSHCDVNSALEEFGKTESLVLHRSAQQAVVLFEKEDDAEKLRMVPSFEVNGVEVHVMRDRETQPTDKKTPAKEKPSVVAASASKTATTGKIAAQATADMDQKSQNTSKALITKAKKTGKAVKSGTQLPKAAEKEAVVSQKTPAESSSPDGKSEQTPETGNKKSEVVGKDTGLVSQSKDGTAVKAKPVLEAKIAKTQTPSDPSGSLDGTGSTASDDQPQTGDNEQKSLKMESEVDKLTEMDSTGKKPSPSCKKLETTSEKVKDETSMDATEPVRTSKDVKSDESGSAAIKEGNVTTEVVASGKTDDEHIEGQPAVSTAVTPSTQKGLINAQAASTYSTADAPLTVGEVIEKHLDIKQIVCLKWKTCQSQRFFQLGLKPMLITGLPEYHDGCYKMEDVVQLLVPFGFQHGDNNIYIVPQIRMAFVKMPTMESVHNLITKARGEERMTFKGAKISFHALGFDNPSSPYGFYTLLMRLMNFHVTDDGSSLVYIDNISLSESKDLRETLKKIGCVKNFLPLLNKLFIEFESVYDADRLGVWYSLLKKPPGHILHREKTPISSCTSPSPKLPEQALPDSTEAVTWATVPSIKSGIPQGSAAPFWIPLKSSPYLFPTISPWFNIPDYLTVTGMDSIKAARSRGSNIIMLTGLQESFYTHQNVAQLVWQYFPEPGIQTLYYNIIVLPLQRRAFVFFPDWTACSNFVQDHVSKPVSLNGNALSVHFVTEPMSLEFSEEMLYKTAMKLCNARVSEMEALEERLLCVEINEAAVHVTQIVLDVVASIAPFVSFLMLGNRICIEMAQPSGVTQVLEVYKSKTELLNQKQMFSDTVQRVENLKSFKQRLQDHGKLRITFECDLLSFDFPSPKNPKTEPPTCEMVENDSKLVLHSSSDLPNVAMNEEGEKPGVEMGKDWGSAPETKDEIKERISAATLHSTADETSDISIEKRCNAPSSPSEEAAATHGRMAEEPQCGEMNRDILKVITETVCQPKLEKEMTMEEENTTQEEITDDMDQEDFNMDDFVTVDEVGADVEDIPAHSSSSTSSTKRRKRTCSRASSSGKQKPTRSSNDSKGSSSSLSLSSSAPKLNEESCHSPKKPADSPEPNKSLDNPSVSDCRSKTSRETFPSSAKETGTGSDDSSVKVFIETQPEQHQEKLVDCAVVTSDHKEAAESSEAEKLPIHKQEEEQEDGENYQILDSFEEQTDGTLDDEDEHGSSLTQPIEPGVSVDEGKTHPGGNVDMSVDVSVPEDPAASALEDIQVQHGSLSVKQLSEGEKNLVVEKSNESAVGDEAIKDGESNKQNELEGSGKDQLPQDPKSPEKDEFEQEIFEILDTIDEATAPQDDNQTPNDQLEKHISHQKEGPTVSSQTESESDKDIRTRKRRTTSRKHDENSKKMGLTSTSEGESPLKQRMAKKYDTRGKVDTSAQRFKKDKEVTKEMELEEDAQNATTSGRPVRRRSARGKKDDKLTPTPTETSETPITDEETPYKILDSVDEETPDDEAKVTRSTRGKRERANKNDALRTPARRRHTAAREAREGSEKKLPEDQETPSPGGEVTGEVCHKDATYKILDSVEDEVVEESPAPTRPRKRGRPKKMVKTKKEKQPLKDDASEKLMKEEELYQVIDSVEDETADDQLVPGRPESSGTEEAPKIGDEQTGDGTSVTGSTKNQEEEQQEPPYQLVDSVITEAVSAETEDTSTCPTAAEASDSIAVTTVNETVSNLGVRGVSAAGEGSGTSNNSSRTERDQEDKPGTKSKTDPLKPEEESQLETPERNTLDTMVNLDEVSEEEENYPDDTAEEEELRKRPADSKEKHERKLREKPRTSTRAQRSRSQEDRGGDGSSRSMDEEREEQDEDSVEEDTKELLTLDEVGADEPEEERATESQDKDDITETELQSLVTLDEVVEEDDKMVEQNSAETHPLREEDQSVDFLNPETLVTIDEAGGEDKEEQEQKHSGKRKLDTETEENPNFVTLDEVGEEEEEKISPRARGRPRKRTRQTPVKVRRSVRGKNVTSKDEEEKEAASVQPATSPEKDESSLSTGSRREPQKTEVKAASAEPQPGNQKLEGCLEGDRSRTDIKAANKQRRKLTGPEAKRACSQSPGVRSSFRLPEFKPNNPLGQEFVVPTSGFFCNLCLVFYRNKKTAREVHCSSRRHYDNLQKYYREIEQNSRQSSQSSISE